jgi:hypothetical protein
MKYVLLTLLMLVGFVSLSANATSPLLQNFGADIDAYCPDLALSALGCKSYNCVTPNPIFGDLKMEHIIYKNETSGICEYRLKNYALVEGEQNIYHKISCDLNGKEAKNLITNAQGKKFAEWNVDTPFIAKFYNDNCYTGF